MHVALKFFLLLISIFSFAFLSSYGQFTTITVSLEDWVLNEETGITTATFGYQNPNDETIYIPVSSNNFFTPPPSNRRQPTSFLPGVHEFTVTYEDSTGMAVTWSLLGQSAAAQLQRVYVNAGASGAETGEDWVNAYTDLQDALAYGAGTEIWVASGVYVPTADPSDRSASFILGRGKLLFGGFSGTETQRDQRDWESNPTVLSGNIINPPVNPGEAIEDASSLGDFSYSVVRAGTNIGPSAVLDGFTITGGHDPRSDFSGGGIKLNGASPKLNNLLIAGNSVNLGGGGIYNDGGSPVLTHVTISHNKNTEFGGGGMYDEHSDSTFMKNVELSHNESPLAGGLMAYSSTIFLTDALINKNIATLGDSGGGGIRSLDSDISLVNVAITGNSAASGGGLYISGGEFVYTNALISGNTAVLGGGVYNVVTSSIMRNVTISSNSANRGGGIYNLNTSDTLYNSILWGNTTAEGYDSYQGGLSSSSIYHSLFAYGDGHYDNYPEIEAHHSDDDDPLFIDADNGNYRLQPGSPAIHFGDPDTELSLYPEDEGGNPVDLDGNPRVQGAAINAGAYESHYFHSIAAPLAVEGTVPIPFGTSFADVFEGHEDADLQMVTIVTLPENGILRVGQNPIESIPTQITAAEAAEELNYVPHNESAYKRNFDTFIYSVSHNEFSSKHEYPVTLHLYSQTEAFHSLTTRGNTGGANIPGENIPFNFTEPFTIEFWINPEDLDTSIRQTIFSTRLTNKPGGFQISVGTSQNAGGTNRVMVTGPGVWIAESPADLIQNDTWTHVAYSRWGNGASDQAIYVNGQAHSLEASSNYTIQSNTDDMLIARGTNLNLNHQFRGNIADLRIWDHQLSSSKIKNRMFENLMGSESGLSGHYIAGKNRGAETEIPSSVGPSAFLAEDGDWDAGRWKPLGVTISGSQGWRIMSSPAEKASYGVLLMDLWTQGFTGSDSPGSEATNVMIWDEAERSFETIGAADDIAPPAEGFIVYVYDDQNFDGTNEGFPKTIRVPHFP